MQTRRITMGPIGIVENGMRFKDCVPGTDWTRIVSKIVVQPELEEALAGLEEYSHAFVLFWLDRVNRKGRSLKTILCDTGGGRHLPRGVLATRAMFRPNPIGLSLVTLIAVSGNVITVKGLDAVDGTPVLDLKPYTGHPRDAVSNPVVPDWATRRYNLPDFNKFVKKT